MDAMSTTRRALLAAALTLLTSGCTHHYVLEQPFDPIRVVEANRRIEGRTVEVVTVDGQTSVWRDVTLGAAIASRLRVEIELADPTAVALPPSGP